MYMQPVGQRVEGALSAMWLDLKKPASEGIPVDLEEHYPYAEGWRVVSHSITPIPTETHMYYLTVLVEKIVQDPEA